MQQRPLTDDEKKQQLAELVSLFLHRHYCENDTELFLDHVDAVFSWIGAAEQEYAVDPEIVRRIFQSFAGRVPRCEISDERYDVIQPAADIFICTGRLWIATPPASGVFLRVHQRITTVFRWTGEGPRCCHLHLSNPYSEMDPTDIGFPEKMSFESRKYFREQIEIQKQQLAAQHEVIVRMSVTDLATGLYNRNRFNQVCEALRHACGSLGIAYFDVNGLKKINDLQGHQAGDDLIRRTAACLLRSFGNKVYRIGGDEFIAIDDESDRDVFHAHASTALRELREAGISMACGLSWRSGQSRIDEQINEADKKMYLAKREFYARKENNRRQR
ncbi:diguanylate cyclase [uncultured Desulfovibrio sp.]|uniref:diguanylate cyclase domain-containing protein n=1 Tax=uncultured Desulfovibrio sp. TaxID=167968 RepID=UPI00260A98E8|nr:diguanylate cyclase [uncultured Desulfovibrio sp.]